MGQDIFDLIIVLTLVYFTVRGIGVGFVGEIAGILSLVAGFWAARSYHGLLEVRLQNWLADPFWRTVAACVLLFVGAMLVVAIAARILQKVMTFSFVSWANRLAGGILGLAKGVLIWGLILIVLQKFFHDSDFMRESRVMPYFNALVDYLRAWLPPDVAQRLGI